MQTVSPSRQPGNVREIVLGILWSLCCGCQSDPAALVGPVYAVPPLTATVESERFQVKFLDARPDWERKHYQGSDDPDASHFGIVFFSAENFTPAIPELLAQSMRHELGEGRDRPREAELKLHSFRVVLNQASMRKDDAVKAKQARQAADRKQADDRHRQRMADLEYEKKLAEAKQSGAALPTPPPMRPLNNDLDRPPRSIFPCPPSDLPLDYDEGITCSLNVSVKLVWTSGRVENYELSAMTRAESDPHTSLAGNTAMARAVRQALVNIGIDLKDKVNADAAKDRASQANRPNDR
ncbi:MAG: hypothetical protein ACKV0T_20685 [Planctomycetales bacterium]